MAISPNYNTILKLAHLFCLPTWSASEPYWTCIYIIHQARAPPAVSIQPQFSPTTTTTTATHPHLQQTTNHRQHDPHIQVQRCHELRRLLGRHRACPQEARRSVPPHGALPTADCAIYVYRCLTRRQVSSRTTSLSRPKQLKSRLPTRSTTRRSWRRSRRRARRSSRARPTASPGTSRPAHPWLLECRFLLSCHVSFPCSGHCAVDIRSR